MIQTTGSKFGAFLDAYNRNNTYLQEIADSFFSRNEADFRFIAAQNDPLLSEKAKKMMQLIDDQKDSGYDKLIKTGGMLDDIARNVVTSADPALKSSGNNLIRNFFDVAKQTGDQQLTRIAIKIASDLDAITNPK